MRPERLHTSGGVAVRGDCQYRVVNSFPAEEPAELAEAEAIRWRLALLKHFYDLYCRLEHKSPTPVRSLRLTMPQPDG